MAVQQFTQCMLRHELTILLRGKISTYYEINVLQHADNKINVLCNVRGMIIECS